MITLSYLTMMEVNMGELWELVDDKRRKTGLLHERGSNKAIPNGMFHIAAEVWIKNRRNELLLTQRHPAKTFGLLWECSGGSVIAGEESLDGVIRELKEETGIEMSAKDLIYRGETFGKDFIIDTYLGILDTGDVSLTLQQEEVFAARFIPIDKISELKENIVDGTWERYSKFESRIREHTLPVQKEK